MRNNQILFAGEETTEGTEAGTLNTVETVDGIQWTPYAGDRVVRNVDRPFVTAGEEVNVNPHQSGTFTMHGAGSGTRTDEAAFSCLLKACGFAYNYDDATPGSEKHIYTLSNDVSKTVSLVRYLGDEFIQKLLGARGNVSFSLNQFFEMNFSNFVGSYIKTAAGNFPGSVTWDNYAEPEPITYDNTQVAKLDNYDVILMGGSINAGSGAQWQNRPGQKFAQHSNLFAEGSLTIKAPTIADKDFFSKMESHNGVEQVNLQLVHGTVDGNTIALSMPCQISNVQETTVGDGEVGFELPLRGLGALVLEIY